jgi:hypothetical protein
MLHTFPFQTQRTARKNAPSLAPFPLPLVSRTGICTRESSCVSKHSTYIVISSQLPMFQAALAAIGAISRQRECSVGTQDSRQSMLNSSQRANAAKHRIRPAPPTQTQVNLLLNQLSIVFFVTLKNPKNCTIWSHFKIQQPGFHTLNS